MQGGFAWLLISRFDTRLGVQVLGTLLLCCWPVFIERTFRHVALSCQWLVLWALYLYFVSRASGRLPWFSFLVLFCVVPGVHAYFLPMAFALLCAAVLENVLRTRRFWRGAGLVCLCMGACLAVARGLGVIMPNMRTDGDGYGGYSMNLNAIFNPSSMDLYADSGRQGWSLLLPQLSQMPHQYDGFNYWGLGVLAALVCMGGYGIYCLCSKGALRRLGRYLYNHIGLVLACAACTLFAVSHVIYFGDTLLATVPLPKALVLYVLATFRASGRVFWPVGYLAVLGVILFTARRFKGRYAVAVLALVLAVQLGDMGGVLAHKAAYFRSGTLTAATDYETEKWEALIADTSYVYCLGNMFDYRLAAGMIRCNPSIQSDIIFFARGNFGVVYLRYEDNNAFLRSGQAIADDVLYVASEESVCREILETASPQVAAWKIDKFYILGNATAARPAPDFT